jgi:hypothetical protein
MRGVSAWVLGLVTALGLAPAAPAFDSELRIDPSSFIRQTGPEREAVYAFPESARLRLRFGARAGRSIPVTIPLDGLLLGVARAERMPALEFRLAEPARGTLQIDGDGGGVLSLAAAVLVQPLGALRAVRYDLTLSVDVVRMGNTGRGWVQIATADEVAMAEGAAAESFSAVIGGTLDSLPPGFE